MHIEYAADAVVAAEAQFKANPTKAAHYVLEGTAAEKEILALADKLGDEKIASIVATMRASSGSRYAKITSRQRFAVAAALLARHGSLRAVMAAAYNVSEEQFMSNAGQ